MQWPLLLNNTRQISYRILFPIKRTQSFTWFPLSIEKRCDVSHSTHDRRDYGAWQGGGTNPKRCMRRCHVQLRFSLRHHVVACGSRDIFTDALSVWSARWPHLLDGFRFHIRMGRELQLSWKTRISIVLKEKILSSGIFFPGASFWLFSVAALDQPHFNLLSQPLWLKEIFF